MHHSMHLVLDHQPGVQLRIAMILTRRGYYMESMNMFPMAGSDLQRMTMTIRGPEAGFDQICKQLHKLVDVVRVDPLFAEVEVPEPVSREEFEVERAV